MSETKLLPDSYYSQKKLDHPQESPHIWDRLTWVWHLLWYCIIAGSTATALVSTEGIHKWSALALGLALACWQYCILLRFSESIERRHWLALFYSIVAIILFAIFTLIHPVSYVLLFCLYSQIYMYLPLRMAIPTSIVLSVIVVGLNITTFGDAIVPGILTTMIFSTVGCIVLGYFISAIIQQSQKRQHLIIELETTRKILAESERRTGVSIERQRLAREIHDTLAQSFSSIVMHLEAADQQLPLECSIPRWHIDQARRTARESLGEARHLVWALRPETLGHGSLTDALERITARWSEETKVSATIKISGDCSSYPSETELMLLRVLQEGLTNIRKHAQARQVRISVSFLGDMITLDIHDDGVGFDPDQLYTQPPVEKQSGFGLCAMRERVASLGGTLTLESTPGKGTTVAVSLSVGIEEKR